MVAIIEVKPKDFRKYYSKVQNIVNGYSEQHKKDLGITSEDKDQYLSLDQYEYIGKRWIMQEDNKVIGFFDILWDGGKDRKYGNICYGIDEDYQGKGYGSRLVKVANKWIDEHLDEFDNIVWSPLETNKASIHLAKKCGFKRFKSRDENREAGKFLGFVKSKKLNEFAMIDPISSIELK